MSNAMVATPLANIQKCFGVQVEQSIMRCELRGKGSKKNVDTAFHGYNSAKRS